MSQPQTFLERRSSQLKAIHTGQLQPSKLNPVGVLLVVLSAIGFSTLAIFGKLAYAHGLNPLSTLSWRLGGAAAVLWLWLLLKRQWQRPHQAAIRETIPAGIAAFCLGALGYALQSALFFSALAHATAGITVLMFYTYPAFVALLSWAIARKPMNSWQAKALGLALLGTVLTVNLDREVASLSGIALGIAAGAGYALYMMLSARLVRNISPLTAAAYMLLGATCTLVIWAGIQQGVMIPTTAGAIVAVSGLAILATALPIVCLFAGLKRLDVVPAAILSTLEPILAVVMGILLFREHLWAGQLLGGALIITSGLMLQAKLGDGK